VGVQGTIQGRRTRFYNEGHHLDGTVWGLAWEVALAI
jgi:hypothetical protein